MTSNLFWNIVLSMLIPLCSTYDHIVLSMIVFVFVIIVLSMCKCNIFIPKSTKKILKYLIVMGKQLKNWLVLI
jgi:hypothetical protein